jgi:hypothetical protein
MQTLKLGTFRNVQTGNTAELVLDQSGICIFYKEICALGTASAGLEPAEGTYWAAWTPKNTTLPVAQSTNNSCLDDALSGLETELADFCIPRPWYAGTTGL